MSAPARPRRGSESYFRTFVNWLQLKEYQYQVTYVGYMLTPTERFVLNTIILVLISLLIAAVTLYLPDHVRTICSRLWYYVHGAGATDSAVHNSSRAAATNAIKAIPKAAMATADAVRQKMGEL